MYINFPKAFWNHEFSPNGVLNGDSHETSPNVRATTAPLHHPLEPGPEAASEQFPGFMHCIHPTYANHTNPAMWNLQGINLATLPASCAHSTLIFYIFGDCARYIASLATTNPPEKVQTALIHFFKPYFALLPRYSESKPECHPTEALATAWAADKWSGYGSYSNFQVGLTEGDRDIEMMRHGLPERRVWLAGEHTAPFVALGTVTGAYWAGEDVAKRIVGTYGLQNGSN